MEARVRAAAATFQRAWAKVPARVRPLLVGCPCSAAGLPALVAARQADLHEERQQRQSGAGGVNAGRLAPRLGPGAREVAALPLTLTLTLILNLTLPLP